jgi:hypothetical protein
MSVDELLELIQRLITEGHLNHITSVQRHEGDWLLIKFTDGRQLAVTVEDFQ